MIIVGNARIESLKREYEELNVYFQKGDQLSFQISTNDLYKRVLLLAASSYFEAEITGMITEYSRKHTKSDPMLLSFIQNKAIARQYHTFFDWKSSNANSFFGLFGDTAKAKANELLSDQESLNAIKSFLELGCERNKLVHLNFIEARVDKTFDEIYKQYIIACGFIEKLRQIFSE
ncbi:MAG: hypothetical protein LBM18_00915 [Oscillospiraceae bacterium]|jgi:hypothetical protein|nr:hypothetical protein [Oscillospiraceae bacterium]